jgi:hypothetical protein
MLYNVLDRTEPCGTPLVYPLAQIFHLQPKLLSFLWERKELISLIRLIEYFNSDKLYSKPRCHVVSKAFSLSKDSVP